MSTRMKAVVGVLLVAAVCSARRPVFAQGQDGPAEGGDALARQAQLIQELRRRLDAQEALNAELLRRLTALEAAQKEAASGLREAPAPTAERLGVVEETALRIEERLDARPKVVGYYDFEFFKEDVPDTFAEFRQHHLSLHFSKEYSKLRVFSEVEFKYAPGFSAPGKADESASSGSIAVEQVWAEYLGSEALVLRAGKMLTPNHWNVNHYPNTTVSTRQPLMVRNVFPESLVGVMASGVKYWGDIGVGYEAFISNGESPNFAEHDDNSAKAVGGSLKFDVPTRGLFDHVTVKAMGYGDTPAAGRATRIWGLESQVRRGPLELLFELGRRRAVEDRDGAYVQPSYRLTDRFRAFYRYDRLFTAADGETEANTWGVNFRPIAPVSLKFEYFRTMPQGGRTFDGVASSLAVAF